VFVATFLWAFGLGIGDGSFIGKRELLAYDLLALALEFALEGLEHAGDSFAEVGGVLFKPSCSGIVVGDLFELVHLGVGEFGADALADANFKFFLGMSHKGAFFVFGHVGETNFVHKIIINPHISSCLTLAVATLALAGRFLYIIIAQEEWIGEGLGDFATRRNIQGFSVSKK
jgi:hypothetical protein